MYEKSLIWNISFDIHVEENVQFDDIFGGLREQIRATRYFIKIKRKRNLILKILEQRKWRYIHQIDGPIAPPLGVCCSNIIDIAHNYLFLYIYYVVEDNKIEIEFYAKLYFIFNWQMKTEIVAGISNLY